ncbi:MAG: glycogen/starch synthase [Dehalococcoidales bacterium]|nr:glycogen/starch synthase [Dehalococcoidales bacterium]
MKDIPLKTLFVAPEAAPLAKIGGLADVVGSLPVVLPALDEGMRTIIPLYGSIDPSLSPLSGSNKGFEFAYCGSPVKVDLRLTHNSGVPLCLLENSLNFSGGEIYSNDLERFTFFSPLLNGTGHSAG